jgi:hypothetical protein
MFRLRFRLSFFLVVFVCSACRSDVSANTSDIATVKNIQGDSLDLRAFDLPMRIEPVLSGSFAELRYNHFHSGIDFKTQQRVNIPIYAPADGWISRFRIESLGFGLALYLDHYNGLTTVFGHLNAFAAPFDGYVKKMQQENERFELDTLMPARRYPVKKGQLIAYSGNSGISAAPHLHFEIRNTKTEEPMDPLLWYSGKIKDHQPPRILQAAIYTLAGEGVLSNGARKMILNVTRNDKSEYVLNGKFPYAWGKIGLGIGAYDYMNGTSNKYGICNIKLFRGEELIFEQDLSIFSFDQTRYVNSLVDYEYWQRSRNYIMKSFVEPGNMLKAYPTLINRGYVDINSSDTRSFRYELTDRSGNCTKFTFNVSGKQQTIPPVQFTGQKMSPWEINNIRKPDFTLDVPTGTFYETIDFKFFQSPGNGFSDRYQVQDRYTPLQRQVQARFRVQKDILDKKRLYYLAKYGSNGLPVYTKAVYRNGWMEANLIEFGTFAVLCDSIVPKITPIGLENVAKNNVIRIRITDNASGIKSWRGTIDGKWVLFSMEGKISTLTCLLRDAGILRAQKHSLELSVFDGCGNENRLIRNFFW